MLYQEIRPTKFEDISGNKSTVKGLQSLCTRSSLDRPHSILLSGPKGCGKTTLGRILAYNFGSKKDNILEVNAADVRGIDGVRSIIENIQYKPIGGGSLTYILDECHRLTKDAQSALLKSTEDTPEHAYFILCTTDPNKLLPTLRNRCTSYTVEQLKSKNILSILERACKVRKLGIDSEVLEIISSHCDRTPRTALVLLEKVSGLSDPEEIVDVLVSEIENVEKGDFFGLCQLLLLQSDRRKQSWAKVLNEFNKLDEDPEKVRNGILSFMRKQLLKIQGNDIDYAKDVTRTMEILSQNLYYGGENLLVTMLMKICLGE